MVQANNRLVWIRDCQGFGIRRRELTRIVENWSKPAGDIETCRELEQDDGRISSSSQVTLTGDIADSFKCWPSPTVSQTAAHHTTHETFSKKKQRCVWLPHLLYPGFFFCSHRGCLDGLLITRCYIAVVGRGSRTESAKNKLLCHYNI